MAVRAVFIVAEIKKLRNKQQIEQTQDRLKELGEDIDHKAENSIDTDKDEAWEDRLEAKLADFEKALRGVQARLDVKIAQYVAVLGREASLEC